MSELADEAIRYRPPWMNLLGEEPDGPDQARQWRHHVAVIAAYRDQHKITDADPRQVLGPYPGSGHAGHSAYWQAAGSVLAARRLSGLDAADGTESADGKARAKVAADIYAALPGAERETIATMIAAAPGITSLGDPDRPDEHAAARPDYAGTLTAALARRGHTTIPRLQRVVRL